MSRIVLDTNSLIQCIPSRSKYRPVWDSYLNGENEFCISGAILNEYEEIIERLAGVKAAKIVVDLILNNHNTIFVYPSYYFEIIKVDPDDNKFVDCAIAANAKCIVTSDHHFDIVKRCPFPKIEIITLDEFLKEIETRSFS